SVCWPWRSGSLSSSTASNSSASRRPTVPSRMNGRNVSNAAPVEEASTPPTEQTSRKSLLQRILAWLTAGYPEGVPPTERYALIALLRRTLTDDEVKEVIAILTAEDSPALEDGIITDEE